MKHDLANPCPHCPFRSDVHGYLTRGRVLEIVDSVLRGQSFPCHKTTVASDDDDDGGSVVTANSQQCAGAEIFCAFHGRSSQMSRIAERLGFKVSTLNMKAPVCKNVREMLRVHAAEQPRKKARR